MSKNVAYIYKPEEHNVYSYNIEDPTPFLNTKNCLINPDLSKVLDLKRQYWKIVNNEFVPKTDAEKTISDLHHSKKSIKNNFLVEVPVEIIKEVEKIREVIREVPVEVIKIIEKIKEVPVEVIKEVIKEVPVEVIKEVEKIVKINVDKIVEKEVIKEVAPKWSIYLNIALGLLSAALMVKLYAG